MAYLGRQPNTGVRSRYIYTATASQTTFSGTDDDGKTLKYEDAAYLDVFLNGVLLKPVTDYTATSKTSVVLTSGAAASDIVEIVAYDIANIANTVSATNGGTFEADVTVQGTVTADGLTVDTNTLYVDSANNRVGVGTVSPSTLLHLGGTAPGDSILRQDSTTSGTNWEIGERSAGKWQIWEDDGDSVVATFMSTGKVGIGTTSPNTGLSVVTGSANGIELGQDSDASTDSARLFFSTSAGSNAIHSSSGAMRFFTGSTAGSSTGTERARIDTSGNLLIGTTDDTVYNNSSSGTGINFQNFGNIAVARDGADCMVLNRLNSNGKILLINKDGSTVGDVGTRAGNLNLGTGDIGLEFHAGDNTIYPCQAGSSYALTNGFSSLGGGSYRFNTIYASNGSINTSDENQKQQISSLTNAEITAATAISKLFKTYKWNDSVDLKGDAARTHTGVIAQQVEQAMTDAGLDASKYAFWCSDTVYEVFTEVPAVDADEENGIEAQEAYTKVEHYNTAEEAPENAIERTTKGVRYAELLSFIGAATEQRLTSIEARLATLENA